MREVINDRKALGEAGKSAERLRERRFIYRNAFAQYAAFCYESSLPGPPPKMDPAAAKTLERWLRISEVKIALGGATLAMDEILAPGYPPERAGYAKLLEKVLNDWLKPADPEGCAMKDFWQSYLVAVATGTISAPVSYEKLITDVIRRFTADQRSEVRPVWDEAAFQLVDRVLNELSEQERSVIRKHYGMDGKAMTLDRIGREFSISRERVYQIEVAALHRLRDPKHSRRLRPLVQSVTQLLTDRLASIKRMVS
ncbi:MAG: sigma factor-like helix-turn-helix DNA-binding protein [Patescibacteria group bacterium]|nr:sigma factor-like helix-turn-helix DNA-binding protein [Patescibacteria group bacterium]